MNDAPASPRQAPGKRISFALAVLMHLGLAALLIYGIRWQTQQPEAVEVQLVSAVPPAPTFTPEPKIEPKPEPKPVPKVEPPPKPLPQPEIAQKEKPKPPPKPEAKPEPPKPAPDPFKEQLERDLKDAEKRKAANAAAQELANLKASTVNSGAMADYIARIRGKVRGNIMLPPDIKGNPEAVFDVTQLPSGEILTVRLKKSSGNPVWDTTTERAILKSSPLPKPPQSELFQRELTLTFRPQED
jgi:colicin import membrane protein